MGQRVICIDESGKFEEREDHARFLGGCVFSGDGNREERNLENQFRAIAQNITEKYKDRFEGNQFQYPDSFHMSDLKVFDENGEKKRINNNDLQRSIRKDILDEVKRYLKQKKSQYRLFALVVPFSNTRGHEDGSGTRDFNLTDFRNPGVLYERLATGLVHNFTFYSLDDDIEKNIFRIASRTPALRQENLTAEERLRLREINDVHYNRGMVYLTQTDINTFKASLSEKMFECGAINTRAVKDLEIACRSIDYSGGGHTGASPLSPFFYLADIVCYYLQRLFYGENDNRNYHGFAFDSEILMQAKRDCVVPAFFWAYEETDGLFKRAVEAYAADRLAECFGALYDMENEREGKCVRYYREYWENKLWNVVKREYIENKNPGFTQRLSEDLLFLEGCMDNKKIEFQKVDFVLDKLETVIREGGYTPSRLQQYRINDLFLRLRNHHGGVEKSKEYFRALLEYSDAVGAEVLAASVNRGVQIYFNQFAYGEVIELCQLIELIAEEEIEKQSERRQEIRELVQKIFGGPSDPSGESGSERTAPREEEGNRFEWIGKLYSTLGQAYAFNRQYEEADRYFEKALCEFSDQNDVKRTKGYRLHAWVAWGTENEDVYEEKRKAYLEHCQEVFDSGDIGGQVEKLIKEGFERVRFDLYLWVKAAYRFGLIQNRDGRTALGKLIEAVRNAGGSQHPWELIYKYLYLLCRDCLDGRETDREYFAARCKESWDEDEEALKVIKIYSAVLLKEDSQESGHTDDRQDETELMNRLTELSRSLEGLNGLEEQDTIEKKKEFLKGRLTYMYS